MLTGPELVEKFMDRFRLVISIVLLPIFIVVIMNVGPVIYQMVNGFIAPTAIPGGVQETALLFVGVLIVVGVAWLSFKWVRTRGFGIFEQT